MKAISLTQPWATLVHLGAKRVETRSWYTSYRGQLVIHAAKGYPRWARDLTETPAFQAALGRDIPDGVVLPWPKQDRWGEPKYREGL